MNFDVLIIDLEDFLNLVSLAFKPAMFDLLLSGREKLREATSLVGVTGAVEQGVVDALLVVPE